MRSPGKSLLLLPALSLGLLPLLLACSSSDAGDEPPTDESAWTESTEMAFGQEPGAGAADQDGGELLDRVAAQKEKRQELARLYVELGDDAFLRGDYQGAAIQYAEAQRLDPANVAARDGLRRAQSALAGQPWEWESSEDALGQAERRRQAQRIRIEGLLTEGDRAMAAGDYDAAIASYRAAREALAVNPTAGGGWVDLQLVEARLQEAEQARASAESARLAAETAAAAEEAAAERRAREEYRENYVRTLLQQANTQFQKGFYDDAVETLDALLEADPRNPEAEELRRIALDAAMADRAEKTSEEFAWEWQKTFDELREDVVPPKSSLEFDVSYWRNVVDKRKPLDDALEEERADPVEASIQAALDETRVVPRFEDMPLEEIARNLSSLAGVNFVVSPTVRDEVDEDLKTINLVFKEAIPVSRLLTILEDLTNREVRFVIRNGAVYVVTAEEAETDLVTRQYEVRDIVRPVQDFVLPELNLVPSGGIDTEPEELPEPEANILTEDELLETIQEVIEPDSWDGEQKTVTVEHGTLIVRHTREVQEQVAQLLEDLRKPANIMVEVTVRFLEVEDSFLQDIGVDFRGLGNDSTVGVPGKGTSNVFDDFGTDFGAPNAPGTIGTGNDPGAFFREASDDINILGRTENLYDTALGDDAVLTNTGGLSLQYTWLDDTQLEMILRAVEKSKRSELVIQPKLMVYNTARANLVVANQISYVADFNVEIASAAAIADPIVRVANDGIYLDVRPVVTADRRFVWIDARPTVATLKRPIPTFQTSLGTGSPVTMMLPELELQKIRARAFVPDGGTLMLGGMKIADQQEMISTVPFLGQIPVLSYFFSRQGNYESYRRLIILLTANIVIPQEHEPSPLPSGF